MTILLYDIALMYYIGSVDFLSSSNTIFASVIATN